MPAKSVIQVRRDTAANWSSINPTLAAGEIGFDTTNNIFKIGDGATAWNSLVSFSRYEDDQTVISSQVFS